jgi:hypothetical protein
MENNFEEYLKDQINGYRMYPSAKVWKKVHNELHGKQRFAIAAVLALLLITILSTLTAPFNATVNQLQNFYSTNLNNNIESTTATWNKTETTGSTSPNSTSKNNSTRTEPNAPITNNAFTMGKANGELKSTDKQLPIIAFNTIYKKGNKRNVDNGFKNKVATNLEKPLKNRVSTDVPDAISENKEEESLAVEMNNIQLDAIAAKDKLSATAIKSTSKIAIIPSKPEAASIAKTIKVKNTTNRIRAQYYATPSISYRSLFDSREKGSSTSNNGGVNNLDKSVFHKPGVGLEAGVNWIFPLDKRIRFKSGMQLNYNRYNIKATNAQPEVATIALYGSNSNLLTSVSTLRNNESTFPKWLENTNLQVSIPVGLEFTLMGNDRIELNIGSSVQPSFLVKNKMYLLSTDLKNYTQEPSLVRRFNINGNIETSITINGKKTRWQIGPSLRYQFLSTYSKKYPFKENLFDYGFKVGFSRPLR